jgi:hypothetical protein
MRSQTQRASRLTVPVEHFRRDRRASLRKGWIGLFVVFAAIFYVLFRFVARHV